jgi:hypothetical protein
MNTHRGTRLRDMTPAALAAVFAGCVLLAALAAGCSGGFSGDGDNAEEFSETIFGSEQDSITFTENPQ